MSHHTTTRHSAEYTESWRETITAVSVVFTAFHRNKSCETSCINTSTAVDFNIKRRNNWKQQIYSRLGVMHSVSDTTVKSGLSAQNCLLNT